MKLLQRIKIAFSDKTLNQELDRRVNEIVIPLRKEVEELYLKVKQELEEFDL